MILKKKMKTLPICFIIVQITYIPSLYFKHCGCLRDPTYRELSTKSLRLFFQKGNVNYHLVASEITLLTEDLAEMCFIIQIFQTFIHLREHYTLPHLEGRSLLINTSLCASLGNVGLQDCLFLWSFTQCFINNGNNCFISLFRRI